MKSSLATLNGVVAELSDPSAELRLLAAKLQEELRNQETRLAVDYFDNNIVISYHRTIVLYWRVADGELACFPTGWRQRTYRTTGAVRAREITIHLLFEFVREFWNGA